jgi:hypothetical protein
MKLIDVGKGIIVNLDAVTMIKRTTAPQSPELTLTFGTVHFVKLSGDDAKKMDALLKKEYDITRL